MNRYGIEDITLGMTESFETEITPDMLEKFRDITGDINPLHNDENYALQRGYSGRVVYGMLAASLYSTLAGVYLPGERCLLHEVNTKFKKPVFIGDTLTVSGTVKELNAEFNRITIDARITNQNGTVVNRATINAGIID
jgi:3-hydroxybutyryl-CoA dehydratase